VIGSARQVRYIPAEINKRLLRMKYQRNERICQRSEGLDWFAVS